MEIYVGELMSKGPIGVAKTVWNGRTIKCGAVVHHDDTG
jgi:hypothetical protein